MIIKKTKQKQNKQKNQKESDVYGDFDIVIPNVKKEKFKEMIYDNFHYSEENKCIIFKKDKLDKLPSCFHLLIEIGINIFQLNLASKIKQIKKYISIINVRNKINNDKIKNEYIEDFEKRFSLNLNSDKNNISKSFVYMLISNSSYSYFYQRFLDNKIYKCDYNNEFEKVSLIAPEEFIFCGFVDFQSKFNSKALLPKEIEDLCSTIAKTNKYRNS